MLRMMIRKNHDNGRRPKESGIVLKIEDTSEDFSRRRVFTPSDLSDGGVHEHQGRS